jgi:pimeloyl-ACP methyl ester carboxylesterase
MMRSRDATLDLAHSDPRGRGRPILFVHGIAHKRSVWEKLVAGLPDDLRPISMDLRGHGESPWSTDAEYDLRNYASDLGALMDHLKIDRAYIVAHSLGGNVATLFASAEPDRVIGLVLVDTGPSLESGATTHITDEIGSALHSYASIGEYRDQLTRIHPSGDSEILDRLATQAVIERIDGRYEQALDPGVLGSAVDSIDLVALERDLWSALGRLTCPVLVVRGGFSAILSETVAHKMVDDVLVEGHLVTLPDAGHAVMIEDGPGLSRAIGDFIPNASPTSP